MSTRLRFRRGTAPFTLLTVDSDIQCRKKIKENILQILNYMNISKKYVSVTLAMVMVFICLCVGWAAKLKLKLPPVFWCCWASVRKVTEPVTCTVPAISRGHTGDFSGVVASTSKAGICPLKWFVCVCVCVFLMAYYKTHQASLKTSASTIS